MPGYREAHGIPGPESFSGRPHGTRLRYLSGCRCTPCRAANSRYECERAAARKRGEGAQLVPAGRARMHLVRLSRLGIGRRAVAEASDVGETTVQMIRAGRKTRIRATTERRILAVDRGALADHALVPAGATWRRIGRLLEAGFTRMEIARRIGKTTPSLQLGKGRVTAINATRIERFTRWIEG